MRAATAKRPDRPAAGEHPDWGELLVKAVSTPGVISDAYRRFWNYSIGNQILAHFQCLERGIEPGPIHTFVGWRDLGRYVKKGEKALILCMPVTVKCRGKAPPDAADGGEEERDPVAGGAADGMEKASTRTCFVYRPHWFVLSQTDGKEYDSPTPRDLREVEAECVALICCSSLGLDDEQFSRGYIQHWLKGETVPQRSAQKIFKAADQILRAGRAAADTSARRGQ